jgi:hypothetical protein
MSAHGLLNDDERRASSAALVRKEFELASQTRIDELMKQMMIREPGPE